MIADRNSQISILQEIAVLYLPVRAPAIGESGPGRSSDQPQCLILCFFLQYKLPGPDVNAHGTAGNKGCIPGGNGTVDLL